LVNWDAPAYLLRNAVAGRGACLRVRAIERSGGDALGATVTVEIGPRRITRVVRAVQGYCSSSDPGLHLGLGRARRVDRILVRWVDGSVDDFAAFDAGQTVELRRPR